MALPIIDARVHVSRTSSNWAKAREALRRAGADTALLSAHPESPRLSDDLRLPLDVAGDDGPYPVYYLGGNPFNGHLRGQAKVPPNFDRYRALQIRCFLSPSPDFGGAVTSANWDPEALDALLGREDLAAFITRAGELGMPIWLVEHFPLTLNIIDRYPEQIFVIPKMGQMNGGTTQVLKALGDAENVYFDTSLGELHESIIKRVGYERVLLASGYPFNEPRECLDQVSALNLPDEQIEAIMGGNVLRLLQRKAGPVEARGEYPKTTPDAPQPIITESDTDGGSHPDA